MSVAVTFEPSWNVALPRSVIVMLLPSALVFQEVARSPTM